jgi:transcriptional regulator with XRE-family HTH domain
MTVDVGRRIKAARSLKRVTVEELAVLVDLQGLGAKTIGNIERGDRPLRPHEAVLLADALEVPVDFLLGEAPAGAAQLDTIEGLLREVIERLDVIEARVAAWGEP